jgi:phosphoserine phosphatase RsbU/P
MAITARQADSRSMRCMEIWGGSGPVDSTVSTPGLDFWVLGEPYRGAAHGGDVYYVSLCGGGITTRFIIADVAGHGEEVSSLAKSLRALMRRHINRKTQARLVKELSRGLFALGTGERFATAVVGTYRAARDELTICNAGHPPPLWYRAAQGEWSFLNAAAGDPATARPNLPLGLDDDLPYHQFSVQLGKGDVILVYTDALFEAVDAAGRPLLAAGLLGIVRSLDASKPAELGRELLARLGRYRGNGEAADDVTVLTLHHNAGRPPWLSLGQKLDVYAKVFRLKRV